MKSCEQVAVCHAEPRRWARRPGVRPRGRQSPRLRARRLATAAASPSPARSLALGPSFHQRHPEPGVLSNVSEVTPGAAAASRCRRQGGDAYGKLRGRDTGVPKPPARGGKFSGGSQGSAALWEPFPLPGCAQNRLGTWRERDGLIKGIEKGRAREERSCSPLGTDKRRSRCCFGVRVEWAELPGPWGCEGVCRCDPEQRASATG